MRPARNKSISVSEHFDSLRADYAGSKDSRWTRKRDAVSGLGRPGDFHIRHQYAYLRMMERARSMDRDDVAIGQIIDRACDHTMQGGFVPDPNTGDRGVNREWKSRWQEYATDPEQCDLAGAMDFQQIEATILRQVMVDGDFFVLPFVEGQLELVEAHRCQSSKGTKRAVCGVVLDDHRRRVEYWFTKNDVDPMAPALPMSDLLPYAARDEHGQPRVLHVYDPRRVSLTRGITALAPIFDFAGMYEDTMFSGVLKQQIANCFVIFRKRLDTWKGGKRAQQTGSQRLEEQEDGSTRTIQDLAPGVEVKGEPGEELSGFNPPTISGEFLPLIKHVLGLIGVNLGLPLVMVLMDASETNFSGWRGAVDMAREGFRGNQRMMVRKFHRPVWDFTVRRWLAGEPALRTRWEAELDKPPGERKFNPFGNKWSLPSWDYIEPFKDAMADAVKFEKGLTSMRRIHAARGMDIDDIWRERIHDTMSLLFKAKRAADRWNAMFPDEPLTMWNVLSPPFGNATDELATQMVVQESQSQTNPAQGEP